jgi:hypothetical protein
MLLDLFRVPAPRSAFTLLLTIILACAVVLILHLEPRVRFFFSVHKRLGLGLLLLGVLLVTFLSIGCNLKAKWGIIDDHEIINFLSLGSNGQVGLTEIPRLLVEQTEVGKITNRFRPSYYTLRLIEASLWGDRPEIWYAARLVMYAVSALLFWLCLYSWLRFLPAALVSIYCLSLGFWADIWCRLGPGETYCVLSTALFVYAGLRLVNAPQPGAKTGNSEFYLWGWVILGTVAASGSKENFLLLVPAAWFIGLVLWRQGRFSWIAATAMLLLAAWGTFVAVRVFLGVSGAGVDVTGGSVTPGHRVRLFWNVIERTLVPVGWWNWAAIAMAIAGVSLTIDDRTRVRKIFRNYSLDKPNHLWYS